MPWVFLAGAVLLEVSGTVSLRAAATGRRLWYAGVVVAYAAAFILFALALQEGLGLGVAYGIWVASGVALTAMASRLLFDEPLTILMSGGIALIAAGVLIVEIGATH